jgi:DNA (cytosine-5)-methyltransferase 1
MGGIGIGLAAAGYRVVKAYDSWPDAVAIYNHNAPEPVASSCDILSSEDRATIRKESRSLADVDLLAAGPPCKGFSQIRNGHHNGPNPHNDVLLAMPEYVAIFRPRLVLIENVPDLARHREGETLRGLLRDLERPGPRGLRYRVEYGVYDAALFGTPQARQRILILAVRVGSGEERLPDASPDLAPLYAAIRHGGEIPDGMQAFANRLADPDDLSMTSGHQALSDLPLLGPGEPEIPRPYASAPRNSFQKVMRAASSELLSNTRTPAVRDETVQRLAMIPPGGCARDIPADKINGLSRRFDSAYRRLNPDAPSTALSTKYDCIYHYGQPRSLSVREYARLQGIPDHISFPDELTCRRHAYEMIGNSVPPLLVHGVLGQLTAPVQRRKAG